MMTMANLQAAALTTHSSQIFNGSAFLLTLLSLTEAPSFIPLTLLLTNILLYVRIIQRSPFHLWLFGSTVTLAATVANFDSALHALSTAPMSLLTLLGLSSAEFFIAFSVVFVYARLSSHSLLKTAWSRTVLFPVLWATTWCIVTHVSPIGRLLMWSPVQGFSNYKWTIQFTGPFGIDWIVAAYAVVLSEAIGFWLMGPGPEDSRDSEENTEVLIAGLDSNHSERPPTSPPAQSRHILKLAALLVALMLPAYITYNAPLPPSSSDTTPFTVGCVLPSSVYDKQSSSPLDNFIAASQMMTTAKLIIWPESAVTFTSQADRDAAFEKVHYGVPGTYVGVSFEEYVSAKSGRVGMKRNGFALIAPQGVQGPFVKIEYYKRQLVPIAESFSIVPSPDPPIMYTLDLGKPSNFHLGKTHWAPPPNYTRPIPLTASICLDFSSPSAFSSLTSRPALILAPGRTWHPSIGRAMWEQVKARAEEMGSMVLWCDGGKGGVSGVAGGGINEITQVGEGSWTRTIGFQWPFDERRSTYARIGNCYILLTMWLLLGGGWAGETIMQSDRPLDAFRKVVDAWKRGRMITRGENTPLLSP